MRDDGSRLSNSSAHRNRHRGYGFPLSRERRQQRPRIALRPLSFVFRAGKCRTDIQAKPRGSAAPARLCFATTEVSNMTRHLFFAIALVGSGILLIAPAEAATRL